MKTKDKGTELGPISTGNTTEMKLEAILNISQAIKDVAKALNDVTTVVNLSNCTIHSGEQSGITIKSGD